MFAFETDALVYNAFFVQFVLKTSDGYRNCFFALYKK